MYMLFYSNEQLMKADLVLKPIRHAAEIHAESCSLKLNIKYNIYTYRSL